MGRKWVPSLLRKKGTETARLKETLAFLLKLLVLALPMYLVIWLSVDLSQLQAMAASELEWTLGAMGYAVERDGFMLTVAGGVPEGRPDVPFSFYIVEDCTAWKSMIFLVALVAAVPAVKWERRALGIAMGLPVLWLGNLARNVSVVLLERAYGLEFAMAVHDWLWKAGLMGMILAVWLSWWMWARKAGKSRGWTGRITAWRMWPKGQA